MSSRIRSSGFPGRIGGWIVVCALALFQPCGSVRAEVLKVEKVEISFRPGHEQLARYFLQVFREESAELASQYGLRFDDDTFIMIAATAKDFDEITHHGEREGPLAVAYPSARIVVANAERILLTADARFRRTLVHELTHLGLGQLESSGGQRFPLWYHEGLAEFAARTPSALRTDLLVLRAKAGRLIPLRELDGRFPYYERDADLAYLQSNSAVRYIARHHGDEAIRSISEKVGKGAAFDEALKASLGFGAEELEWLWIEELRSESTIVALISGLYRTGALFGLLAVLVVIVYIPVRIRARRRLRTWGEEEKAQEAPPGDGADDSDAGAQT